MKPNASRKNHIQRVCQAATRLIFSSYKAGRLTEAEFERLTRALEAIRSDTLTDEALSVLLEPGES